MAYDDKQFWQDVVERLGADYQAQRHVDRYKRRLLENRITIGERIADLREGMPGYCSAIEAVVSDVRVMMAQQKLAYLRQRRDLKWESVNLDVSEATGLEKDSFTFDPLSVSIRMRSGTFGDEADSFNATVDGYRNLVREALFNPLVAHHMVNDPVLPTWLTELSECLTGPDLGRSYRKLIEACLEEPSEARRWHKAAKGSSLPGWFETFTGLMALRREFPTLKGCS